MKIEFWISSAAVTTVASLISAILSALIARKTAVTTANKEIEKMKLSWEREDTVSSDDEFAEMAKEVAGFVVLSNGCNDYNALRAIAAVRIKETGEVLRILNDLYVAVQSDDFSRADALLREATEARKNQRSKAR